MFQESLGWRIRLHSHLSRRWGDGLVLDVVPLPIVVVEVSCLILAGRHREDMRKGVEG